jgi:APA family basic amino acid/polyamine antiporter
MGISRLAFSLSRFQLIPPGLSRIHPRFKTPYPSIVLFGIAAIAIQVPGFFLPDLFSQLGGLYAFGSMLAFSFAHAAIVTLRIRKPDLARPFKLKPNLRIGGRELPIPAILGFLGTFAIWVVIVILQPLSRYIGILWMLAGLVFFLAYRLKRLVSAKKREEAP